MAYFPTLLWARGACEKHIDGTKPNSSANALIRCWRTLWSEGAHDRGLLEVVVFRSTSAENAKSTDGDIPELHQQVAGFLAFLVIRFVTER